MFPAYPKGKFFLGDLRFSMALFCAFAASVHAYAGMYAYVPQPGNPMPYYFSGTKSRAEGSVLTDEGHRTEMWFWIGGELVAHWVYDGGNIVVYNGGYNFMFDSSHFAHGSKVTIKIKGTNSVGQSAEVTAEAPKLK